MSRIRLAPIALFIVTGGADPSVTLPMTTDPVPTAWWPIYVHKWFAAVEVIRLAADKRRL